MEWLGRGTSSTPVNFQPKPDRVAEALDAVGLFEPALRVDGSDILVGPELCLKFGEDLR